MIMPQTNYWGDLVGNTPLQQLTCLLSDNQFKLYAKLEMFNPGGSMKDRAATSILSAALHRGEVHRDGTVIESSSGNMGIGLAQACLHFGLRFICVVDERANRQNIKIMQAFGAQVEAVHSTPGNSDLLKLRLNRVKELIETIPGSYWPNQYNNPDAPRGYYGLMSEIEAQLDGPIDYLFCATGTCGTIRGCADYIAAHNLPTKIIAVDAVGSVIFGGKPGKRLIPGHGASIQPGLFTPNLAHDIVYTSDMDCVTGCRLLLRHETLLCGGSSGAIVVALHSYAQKIPAGANVVAILPDRGDRYLDTIYNETWVTNLNSNKKDYQIYAK
jgi:2,3-diaminopropionate biosynthesis protein SbnA